MPYVHFLFYFPLVFCISELYDKKKKKDILVLAGWLGQEM